MYYTSRISRTRGPPSTEGSNQLRRALSTSSMAFATHLRAALHASTSFKVVASPSNSDRFWSDAIKVEAVGEWPIVFMANKAKPTSEAA